MHTGSPSPFSLLIKPASADCNLACRYCFYLGHEAMFPETRVHRMRPDTLETLVRSYMQTPQPQYVFGWQGGEPTCMGLDFFRLATDLQIRHAPPHASIANGLQTNATLIDEGMAAHFAAYRFLVGVSLDGPPAMHDQYRTTRSGSGSHTLVLRGIDCLRRHGVEFNILVLVSKANVAHARAVYAYLCDQGFLHHQYIPCVEFGDAGTPQPYAITAGEWGDFLCELYDAWRARDTYRVSIRLFDSLIDYLASGRRQTCSMGVDCRQYFVVEHDGGVYPCDFYVHPKWKLGEVGKESWEAMRQGDLYRQFGRRKSKWNRACDACAYLPVCSGDCIKNRLRRDADPVKGDPRQRSWLCEGWKQFYGHAIADLRTLAAEVNANRMSPSPFPPTTPLDPASRSAPERDASPNAPCPCGSGKKSKRCCGRK